MQVWIGLLCVIGFLPMFIHLAVKLEKQFGNYVTQHATLSYSYIFVVGVLTTQCKSWDELFLNLLSYKVVKSYALQLG